MNEYAKQLWLNALDSGDYIFNNKYLKTREGKHCPFGVLCEVFKKEVDNTCYFRYIKNSEGQRFYCDNKIWFCILPPRVKEWANLTEEDITALFNLNEASQSYFNVINYISTL